MSSSFERTFSALRESRSRWPNAAIACAIVTLGLWVIWAGFSEVAVYKTSRAAHLEPLLAPTRIATVVSGRITEAYLQVGRRVRENDILLQLDPTEERILADISNERIHTLIPQLESLTRELALEADAVVQGGRSETSNEGELRAHLRSAQADQLAAERDLAREIDAVKAGVSPVVAREKAETAVAQRRAAVEAIQHQLAAIVASHLEHGDSRRVHAEQLERQRTELANALAAARSELAQHQAAIERHTIRAPVAGVLGEVNALRPGAAVHEGDVIATVVPDGALHVVAEYGPEALGRLRPLQPAHVRLEGFPWTHYGTLAATVISVGSELRNNAIRVELDLAPQHEFVISNGMTGAVDIEVDRVSPIGLFSRMLGEQSR